MERGKKRRFSSTEEASSSKHKGEELSAAQTALVLQAPQKKKSTGSSGIKTSSLFRNNPEIPQMHRPAVSQLKESIFTSDSFTQMNLHPHLVTTLNKVFSASMVTMVQRQTVPLLLSGHDAMVRSQTGSGKTLAYAIPVVQSLQAVHPKVSRGDGPLALIIVPTRELAQQTFCTFQKLLKPFTWIVPGVLMGGEKRKAEKARLRKGINILVSTPGRLVDHIRNTLSIAFSAIRWLVVDEADSIHMWISGVTRLADICLKDSVSVTVSGLSSSDPAACSPAKTDHVTSSQSESFVIPEALKQFVVIVPSKVRLVCLAAFILDKCKNNKLIVFISSCETVEFLYMLFTSVLCGSNQNSGVIFLRLHGNMKQEARMKTVQMSFSSSPCVVVESCCVQSDVAARGLDLPQVTWILQYTPPMAAAEYVHRVGRTARVGEAGNSLIFLTPAETAFIEELANHNISLSEIKLLDILSSLMMDDTYKGRGKYHSKIEMFLRELSRHECVVSPMRLISLGWHSAPLKRSMVHSLRANNGQRLEDPTENRQRVVDFYRDMYSIKCLEEPEVELSFLEVMPQSSSRALEQETRERATVLQTEFETFVHSDVVSVHAARTALQSFLRAYTTYPAHLKHIFHIRSLHLGHTAKSFGLREAPQALSTANHPPGGRAKHHSRRRNQNRPDRQVTPSGRSRELQLLRSEFSSGMEGRKKKKKATFGQHGEEDKCAND
ncbi:putative ATP-dependent RNA helicase DDX31 [Takifugu flavidus]|uniref:ATP-dependent RNA helicase n=1 Tax=Takifugu flavidus TaxID=433684 RepID=A0A5C6N063_9TELE|nr:putative ATP-dependent RNA helicase DDX31 [Takifugu flavidus]